LKNVLGNPSSGDIILIEKTKTYNTSILTNGPFIMTLFAVFFIFGVSNMTRSALEAKAFISFGNVLGQQ
jgi:hypothetical protein